MFDKEIALKRAQTMTGFADDVRTPEDVREVLQKLAGNDPDVWDAFIANNQLMETARLIAKEERAKLSR